MHGIPIVYKDNIDTAAVRTTVGTRLFLERVPKGDAEVVRLLAEAGAVMLGKSNMNELAAGGPGGHNKFFGDTRNPWNFQHESGGSSSGTGAAIAAGLCLGGVGTDSGGSIRGPASHMGIVGIRPTFGLVSVAGVFPRAPSLDTCGPLAATVADAALLLNTLACRRTPEALPPAEGLAGVRIGLIERYALQGVDADVAGAVRGAVDILARLGAEILPMRQAELEGDTIADTAIELLVYEFKQIFEATYLGSDPKNFGPVVHSDMLRASRLTEADYGRAVQHRETFAAQMQTLLGKVDVLVTPTMPTTAPFIAHPDLSGRHRRFTIPVSLAGLPAVSLPCGLDSAALPIGLQLVGQKLREEELLAIAIAYERATGEFRTRAPVPLARD